MNRPIPEVENLPSWKLRLLETIQNTAADHAKAARHGFPDHEPHDGGGDIKVQTWRTHLLVLRADLHEIELRARGVGVPSAAIEAAREAGEWGQRWGDSVHSPPVMRHGEEPVRAHMVSGIAADVWQLEHMAMIRVAHETRCHDRRFPHDPRAVEQFDRNMAALWQRAAAVAQVIELTGTEARELWGRDRHGWQQLGEVTVGSYSDTELYERWRTHTWRGLEHNARRGTDNLGVPAGTDLAGPRPPSPPILIEHATEALSMQSAGRRADSQVEAALANTPEPTWTEEPGPDPNPTREAGHGVDRDL
ncbi:hypothetical protein [Nocardia suismassiliense]|uniref:hypothetical protein n=1 Tax=Nocardia suismassiliense TaxID=2077092 RepID=UPI00131EF50E|nr:hypothetical protein [Nocardia suismassiliense]